MPYLYYGDEVGLMGGNDPLCRGTMVWEEEKQDLDLLQFFKQMIRIRKNHEVLTFGDFKIEQVEEKSFSFSRVWPKKEKNEEIFILFNMGHEPSMLKSKAGKYKDLLSNKVVNLEDSITVEPLSFNVYGTMRNELEPSDK